MSDATTDGLYDDGAPDEPPAGGFPDRRHGSRRQQDELLVRAESWTRALFVHRLAPLAIVAALTWFGTSLANRIVWPRDDVQALDRKFTTKDSIMSVRVSRIEDGQSDIKAQLGSIAESMRFLTYMACQATDKDRRPNTCYVVAKEIP